MANLKYIGKNILNHDLIVRKGNVSGSATSTGSFGRVETAGNLSVAGGTLFGRTYDHFDIKSGKNIRLYLDNDDNSSFCKFQIHDGSGDTVFAVAESGNATIGEGITANHIDGLSVVGSVSASAAGTGSFGHLIIGNGGDIELIEDQRIYFEADKGTWIETDTTDRLRFVVGGSQMLLLDQDDGRVNVGYGMKLGVGLGNHTSPGKELEVAGDISGSGTGSFSSLVVADKVQGDLTIGDSLTSNKGATFNAAQSSAHDFRALSVNKNYMLYVDANKDKVGIGFQNPEGKHLSSSLHIAGDLTTDSHITASGNFSGSLISTGSFGTLETSGVVNATGRIFENGTSVIDHATAMAIVFGG